MPIWTIYCHIHSESKRAYVGLTSQTMEKRWKNHIHAAMTSKNGRWHFPNAIRKYGKEAFSHRVLEICDSLEKANWREEAWIELFETRDPRFGFNLMRGGAHVPHPIRKNPWNDPEYRKKMEGNSKKLWENSVMLIEASKRSRKKWEDSEYRSQYKKIWENPQHREKCLSGFSQHTKNLKSITHCPNGHEYTSENTLNYNGRECRICHLHKNKIRKRLLKTHCIRGHELTPNNVYRNKNGNRLCIVCKSFCPNGHALVPENLCKNERKCRICVNARNKLAYERRRSYL